VLTVLSSQVKDRLDALVISVKDDSSRLAAIHEIVQEIRIQSEVSSLNSATRDGLGSLLYGPDEAYKIVAQSRILDALEFEGMYGRYEAVDQAYLETLKWIFQDDERDNNSTSNSDSSVESGFPYADTGMEEEHKAQARRLFLSWLSSGEGIFHFSGKLGSGKSTLMKYLCENTCTRSLLMKWAGK